MFKKFTLALLAVFSISASAHAVSTAAEQARWNYATGTVNSTTFSPLVASTVKAVKGISVLNTGSVAMYVGIALAGASSNSEVTSLIVPASMTIAPLYIPFVTSQGVRISIKTISSQVVTGEFQLNALYN